MLDHIILNVSAYERSKAFYDAALAPLGLSAVEDGGFCGYGSFFVTAREPVATGVHLAWRAPNRDIVHAFHEAALSAGGIDNGSPGPRPDYGPDYYAGFVLDPDGNNIEVVSSG